MLNDPAFRELYTKECHVCTNTMRIFAHLEKQCTEPAELARILGVSAFAVENLAEAEYCDPHLVVRICRYLDLPIPENCARMATSPV